MTSGIFKVKAGSTKKLFNWFDNRRVPLVLLVQHAKGVSFKFSVLSENKTVQLVPLVPLVQQQKSSISSIGFISSISSGKGRSPRGQPLR